MERTGIQLLIGGLVRHVSEYRCTCLLDKRKKCEVRIPQRLLNVWWHTTENLWYLYLLVFLIPYCTDKYTKG